MRLLKDLHPVSASQQYLRQHLHGIDIDNFAIELARLALTLADIPNPDGWDVRQDDMFMSDTLERLADKAMVLLANPPFENFRQTDRDHYARQGVRHTYLNKTAELLHRVLPRLHPGAVFGVVIPQGLLQSKNTSDLRALIAREFEIAEICLFPDKIFMFSDMELGCLNRPSAVDRFLDFSSQSRFSHVWWPSIFNHTRGLLGHQRRPILVFATH